MKLQSRILLEQLLAKLSYDQKEGFISEEVRQTRSEELQLMQDRFEIELMRLGVRLTN